MKKQGKFFNSKLKKIVIILLGIIILISVIVLAYQSINRVKEDETEIQNSVNQAEGEIIIKELSSGDFAVDINAKTISFEGEFFGGSYCITSGDTPTLKDNWQTIESTSMYLALESSAEIANIRVYYMAETVSNMSSYDATATVYTISTADELDLFAKQVNNGTTFEGKTVIVLDNITASSTLASIGTTSNYFKGVFNGNSYTITLTSSLIYGLFRNIENATIKNVKVASEKSIGTEKTNNVGSIVGNAINSTIKNCTNENIKVIGISNIGGIVGMTENVTISNCNNKGAIQANYYAGGIVGKSINSFAIDCKNSGNVVATNAASVTLSIGGIIGLATDSSIKNCYNSAKVDAGSDTQIGGIVGTYDVGAECQIYNCKNTGDINGESTVGGIIGGVGNTRGSTTIEKLYIKYCTNEANITATGNFNVGGIVGWTHEDCTNVEILNCKNSGTVMLSKSVVPVAGDCGGIVGDFGRGTIKYCINTGDVINKVKRNTGGIIGHHEGTGSNILVDSCLNTGNLTESTSESTRDTVGIGGILGSTNVGTHGKSTTNITITNCGNSGNVVQTAGNKNVRTEYLVYIMAHQVIVR